MDDIKIPNLSKQLQEPYKELMQDLDWTVGDYGFEYEVEITESDEDSAHLEITITHTSGTTYVLECIIYPERIKPYKPAQIHCYEDVWEEATRENIWKRLFFQADRRLG